MRQPATRRSRRQRRGMVVVDSSAVVAILFGEPSAMALLARLAADPHRVMSVANYVESGTVLAGRRRGDRTQAIADLDAFLDEAAIELAPIDAVQARLALEARIRYGRSMGHGGVLNFGDAFAYALAKVHVAPLLYIGDDSSATDITTALGAVPA
jgi:ribonuclease VapC